MKQERSNMQIQPYLFFEGRADEAISFYEKTLGAKLVMRVRFKDNPDGAPRIPPSPTT
jgi:PhnB protein